MKNQFYGDAVINLYPQVRAVDDSLGILDGDGNQVVVDDAAVSVEVARLQAEYESSQYKRKRAAEYPDFRDYIDGIVKGDQSQVQAYIDACLAVKAKYPKE